jgi:hypothetical protein
MLLGHVEEWGEFWTFWAKVVSEWCQHGDELVASMCKRKNAEFVEDVLYVGDGGKQPGNVVLIDALREEGDDAEKLSGVRTKFLEHRGGE